MPGRRRKARTKMKKKRKKEGEGWRKGMRKGNKDRKNEIRCQVCEGLCIQLQYLLRRALALNRPHWRRESARERDIDNRGVVDIRGGGVENPRVGKPETSVSPSHCRHRHAITWILVRTPFSPKWSSDQKKKKRKKIFFFISVLFWLSKKKKKFFSFSNRTKVIFQESPLIYQLRVFFKTNKQ